MAKDQLGHGSNARGTGAQGMRLVKTHVLGPHSAKVYKNPEWGENVVKFFRNGAYQSKADSHTDDLADAHATAKYQLQRWADQDAKSRPVGSGQAASELASGAKSTTIPTHDSMGTPRPSDNIQNAAAKRGYDHGGVGPNDQRVGSRDYDAFGRPRSDESKAAYDEGSRDLAYRSRNGGIGSGGRR